MIVFLVSGKCSLKNIATWMSTTKGRTLMDDVASIMRDEGDEGQIICTLQELIKDKKIPLKDGEVIHFICHGGSGAVGIGDDAENFICCEPLKSKKDLPKELRPSLEEVMEEFGRSRPEIFNSQRQIYLHACDGNVPSNATIDQIAVSTKSACMCIKDGMSNARRKLKIKNEILLEVIGTNGSSLSSPGQVCAVVDISDKAHSLEKEQRIAEHMKKHFNGDTNVYLTYYDLMCAKLNILGQRIEQQEMPDNSELVKQVSSIVTEHAKLMGEKTKLCSDEILIACNQAGILNATCIQYQNKKYNALELNKAYWPETTLAEDVGRKALMEELADFKKQKKVKEVPKDGENEEIKSLKVQYEVIVPTQQWIKNRQGVEDKPKLE